MNHLFFVKSSILLFLSFSSLCIYNQESKPSDLFGPLFTKWKETTKTTKNKHLLEHNVSPIDTVRIAIIGFGVIDLSVDSFFFVSAKKNIGINKLLNSLKNLSINSEWMYKHNEITNKDEIFISNECTRNAILKYLHKELPYNIKVKNIDFKYLKNGDIKIKQQLLIEDLRYKKIILGKKGEKIKSIRESSQIQIKKILEKKIHLYLEIMKFNAKKS